MRARPIKLFFDGGCRPNPGRMEAAVVVSGKLHYRDDLGPGDSEEAEWLALVYAIEIAATLGLPDIVLLGDSAAVIGQAQGTMNCRRFAALRAHFKSVAATLAHVRLRHIARTQNLAGIALARRP